MPKTSSVWRQRSLRRREKTALPSLPPAELPLGQSSRGLWHNGYPLHLLLGNAPTSALPSIPPGVSPPEWEPALQTPPFSAPTVTGPCPQSKWQHHSPDWVGSPSPSRATSKVTLEEPPHSKQKEEMPFHKALSWSCQEAFSRDSRLVQKAREDYY